ncbi:SAVED domain-containing protein [Hyalangium versicolor]|uniref:SAVED domain-containing protein n=1 Tax=Hyalangium versicolor TaxID=2861190 RepID=UPI001CCD3B33|nr:SAVED domain-containing protein [Hyalangium versicolor]
MDIPIRSRSRALILRYEHDRPVIESAARDALSRSGHEGHQDVADVVLHPHDAARGIRDQQPQDWAWAFHENERFADLLLQKEANLGLDHLPVHLFGCAPLVLMLHLGWRLSRRTLHVYQQSLADGAWAPGHDRTQPSTREDFFQVEGLPATRQGGHGYVALIVEVTKSIKDRAVADFQARYPSELLATVCLRPTRGPSTNAVQHPGEVSRAVEQFRSVLDTLHDRLEGAKAVLLVMDCPASFAAALGTAFNPNTQRPLWLHHFFPDKGYLPVHLMRPQRRAAQVPATREQILEASRVLGEVRKVHEELAHWLKEPEQRSLVDLVDGENLLHSQINSTPATETEPLFRYLQGEWRFHVDLLLALKALRERLASPTDWKECVRLLIIHEAYHVRQGGLTSYNYSGSGRTGWVLEAVDYDADDVAVQVAFAWRQAKQPGVVKDEGQARTLEAIVWNILESLRMFEPERPIRDLSERRLRRYLIWLFHACRLGVQASRKQDGTPLEERVIVEIAGLQGFPDAYESYPQQRVQLEGAEQSDSLGLAIYYQRTLVRESDKELIAAVLQVLSRWDSLSRAEAQDQMKLHFGRLFDRHRSLLNPRT